MNTTRGKFIVIEGPDGSGKSGVIELVKKELENRGIKTVYTREPGGTPIAEKIRDILQDKENRDMSVRCDLLLYCAARADHVEKVIAPAISESSNVICDRFFGSTVAYQVYARGRDSIINEFDTLNKIVVADNIPDMWILLDVESEVGMERNRKSGDKNSRFDLEKLEFHKRVRDGYHKFFDKYAKGAPNKIIDTTNMTKDQVAKVALDSILEFLQSDK